MKELVSCRSTLLRELRKTRYRLRKCAPPPRVANRFRSSLQIRAVGVKVSVARVAVKRHASCRSAWSSGGPRCRRSLMDRRAEGTPASSAAVMKAWRSVCGPVRLSMLARRATRRTMRRVTLWSSRSTLAVTKIGPQAVPQWPGYPPWRCAVPKVRSRLRHTWGVRSACGGPSGGQKPRCRLRGLRQPQPVPRQERASPVTLRGVAGNQQAGARCEPTKTILTPHG